MTTAMHDNEYTPPSPTHFLCWHLLPSSARVNVWDPAKWVSRVRAVSTGKAPVLLRVSDTDGHHGPGNTLDSLRDAAMEMAFLEHHLVPSETVVR